MDSSKPYQHPLITPSRLMLLSLILASALPLAAVAQQDPPPRPMTFQQLDRDNDGAITKKEFDQARTDRAAAMAEAGRPMGHQAGAPVFDALDSDNDGRVTQEEFDAAAHRAPMAGQMRRGAAAPADHSNMAGQPGRGRNMPTFADIDTNGDGCIDASEFATHQATHRQMRARMMGTPATETPESNPE